MYGFLTNFEVEGPTLANGTETYEFVKSVGTKG
jgi:PRTRC genetic system protein C